MQLGQGYLPVNLIGCFQSIIFILFQNAFSNSSTLSRLLKVPSEIDCLEYYVKLFQTDGAA